MQLILRFLPIHLLVALGFAGLAAPVSAEEQSAAEAMATVITSDSLEMISGSSVNRFFFTGSVKVRGNNLDATCDEMEVISLRVGEREDTEGGTIGQIGAISRINLIGNVVIRQAGRVARAGHAEIVPTEGRVILTENPVVTDAEGTVSGYRMELVQGDRVARVFGHPDGTQRPRLTLPTMPDLGYETDDERAAKRSKEEGR